MVITMRAMGEVQVAVDEVVDMVSVRHCLMPAVRAVAMPGLMPTAPMGWGTCRRVLLGDIKPMFIDMVVMRVVEVSVMEIIGVAIMGDGRMSAVHTMLMPMLLMNGVVTHRGTPFVDWAGSGFVVTV